VLRQLPAITDPRVLVGHNTVDDAAVVRLSDETALVLTIDFFPPVVDDPYDYGRIAAANATSDIYAMGALPLVALNVVCFPSSLPNEVLAEILRGGADKAAEAGFAIAGGHTLDDPEPKYGLVVVGLVRPGAQVTNATARPGDALILTKPLGTGIITTAIKAGVAPETAARRAVEVMARLNAHASQAMLAVGVSAATDVTGYGLLGHLHEMTAASHAGARIHAGRVPVIEEAWALAAEGIIPAGSWSNLDSLETAVVWAPGLRENANIVLADAQTSGGLLIAVEPAKTESLLRELHRLGVAEAVVIGEMVEDPQGRIWVEP